MSDIIDFDELLTQWKRPLTAALQNIPAANAKKKELEEYQTRIKGLISVLLGGGLTTRDVARLFGIENWPEASRPDKLKILSEESVLSDVQIAAFRADIGAQDIKVAAPKAKRPVGRPREVFEDVRAAPVKERRRDVLDITQKPNPKPRQKKLPITVSSPYDSLKLIVDPIDALPEAIERARQWIRESGQSDPNGDPYQNVVKATAERYGVDIAEAQKLLLRRLDYWESSLPGKEQVRPSRKDFPPIAPHIQTLPTPTADMRRAAVKARARTPIHHHARGHYIPTIPGSKEELFAGLPGRRAAPTHGKQDAPTKVGYKHIEKLKILLADEKNLSFLREKFKRKKPSSLRIWADKNLAVLKAGFSSTKYGFLILSPKRPEGSRIFYASLKELGPSCSFNCHAKDVCYGGASGMTKRFEADDLFREAFSLELQILARVTQPVVRVMDMGDIPDDKFARMLVDTVSDPRIEDSVALWVVTNKHSSANPDAWITYHAGYTDEERQRDMAVGDIMLAGALRHPSQIHLQFSTMFANIPGTMHFSGKAEVPTTSFAVTHDGKREKSAVLCRMHSPKLAVDAVAVFALQTGDVMDFDMHRKIQNGVQIKCSTCQDCPEESDPFTGVSTVLTEHGGKISADVNWGDTVIKTSRGGSRIIGARKLEWYTGKVTVTRLNQ